MPVRLLSQLGSSNHWLVPPPLPPPPSRCPWSMPDMVLIPGLDPEQRVLVPCSRCQVCVCLGVLDMDVSDSRCSTQLCLQNVTSSGLCDWDVNHWQHMVRREKQTGAAVSLISPAHIVSYCARRPGSGAALTPEPLLFILFFIYCNIQLSQAATACADNSVPVITVWRVWCQRNDFRKKAGSHVTSPYLFYLITLQMTNKTSLPVGHHDADWQSLFYTCLILERAALL